VAAGQNASLEARILSGQPFRAVSKLLASPRRICEHLQHDDLTATMNGNLDIGNYLNRVLRDWEASQDAFAKNVHPEPHRPIPFFRNPAFVFALFSLAPTTLVAKVLEVVQLRHMINAHTGVSQFLANNPHTEETDDWNQNHAFQ
jgi:hypothetical protein